MGDYIPRRGDIIAIDFQPQSGREITKRRPALVLSATAYNHKVKLAICCPVTSQVKGYPFEVELPSKLPVDGVVLADQVKCLDWVKRRAAFICEAPPQVLEEVLGKLNALLFTDL